MPNAPFCEILMATHNGAKFVGEQIESLQAQTFQNWNLLVSDDASSDETLKIVNEYSAKDPRIRVISEGLRHGGAKENFFWLMRKSRAEYVMFCDQDDVWREDKMQRELDAITQAEAKLPPNTPVLAHCDVELVFENLNPYGQLMYRSIRVKPQGCTHASFFLTNVTAGCTIAMNRACVQFSLLQENIEHILWHDWWVGLVAQTLGCRAYLDEPLLKYRQHNASAVGARAPSYSKRAAKLVKRLKHSGIKRRCEELVAGERKKIFQTQLFLETYSNFMTEEQIKEANEIVNLPQLSFMKKCKTLSKHKAWRWTFPMRLRQAIALFLMK